MFINTPFIQTHLNSHIYLLKKYVLFPSMLEISKKKTHTIFKHAVYVHTSIYRYLYLPAFQLSAYPSFFIYLHTAFPSIYLHCCSISMSSQKERVKTTADTAFCFKILIIEKDQLLSLFYLFILIYLPCFLLY